MKSRLGLVSVCAQLRLVAPLVWIVVPGWAIGMAACVPTTPVEALVGAPARGGSGGAVVSGGSGGGSPSGGSGGAAGRAGSGGSASGGGASGETTGTGGIGRGDGGQGGASGGGAGGGPTGGTNGTGGQPAGADGGGIADAGGGLPPGAYQVYLGQTHAHSDLSRATHDEFPGMDMPAAGFAKAKARGADFYFITDHVDGSDSTSITPKDFQTIKTAAAAATDATFVAVAGIEYHLDENEMNMVGQDFDAGHKTLHRPGPAYIDFLLGRPGAALIQWNHPVRDGEGEQKFAGYTAERDKVAALVEVLNGDETPAAASYQKALDLGWHVGPAAGHDNHGDSWYTLATRTGVLAPALTRDEILEAIRQQRVFCSQDPAIKIWYDLNGSIMGSTTAPAATYKVTLKIEGGAKVSRIEIVAKGGTVVTSATPAGGTWSADIPAQPGNFYYARLTGAGNVRSWTAPVWVSAR